MKSLSNCRIGAGPMSKNVVDACISFSNSTGRPLLLIPSRNQVDYDYGYSNHWISRTLSQYVQQRTSLIHLMRDHGGPGQGRTEDDGIMSLAADCMYFDLIHVDPWKVATCLKDGADITAALIKRCFGISPSIRYEIGTEEAIWPYTPEDLEGLIVRLKRALLPVEFKQIAYAVIQTGTGLHGTANIGQFSRSRLRHMVQVCQEHGLMAKVHNGDFLPPAVVREHFKMGVSAINVAPELGQIETRTYLECMDTSLRAAFHEMCFKSKRWVRWLGPDGGSLDDIMLVSGHYLFSHPDFIVHIRPNLSPDIDREVQDRVVARLSELHE